MTPGLIKSSRKCELLYRNTIGKSKESDVYNKYLRYRNTYNIIKRQTKYTHYEDLLNKHENDIRKTLRVLNNIAGRSHDKTTISDTFIVNGDQVNNKTVIANEFCSYFTNIGRQYAEAIPK